MHVKDQDLVAKLSEGLDGPPLLAAVYARFDSPLGFARWLTPLGNYLVARPAARAAAGAATEKTDVPLEASVVLGLTPVALQVWSADVMLGQVKEHLATVPRDQVAAIVTSPGRTWQDLTVTMVNGHAFTVQARGGVHALIEAFDHPVLA